MQLKDKMSDFFILCFYYMFLLKYKNMFFNVVYSISKLFFTTMANEAELNKRKRKWILCILTGLLLEFYLPVLNS